MRLVSILKSNFVLILNDNIKIKKKKKKKIIIVNE